MQVRNGSIVQTAISDPFKQIILVNAVLLTPKGKTEPIGIRSLDGKKVLNYTNIKNVWRYDTRGDY